MPAGITGRGSCGNAIREWVCRSRDGQRKNPVWDKSCQEEKRIQTGEGDTKCGRKGEEEKFWKKWSILVAKNEHGRSMQVGILSKKKNE